MRVELELTTEERQALDRFMAHAGIKNESEAVRIALMDWLIGSGWLTLPFQLDEDTETVREAQAASALGATNAKEARHLAAAGELDE